MIEKLQNGTDIRGIAIKHEENEVNLTTDVVKKLGCGFLNWLKKDKKLKIAIGIDSRLSGPSLKEALIETLTNCGHDVYDCGISTTPGMFMTTIFEGYKCDGAIMITASHLPYFYNGLKFFTSDGGCENEDIKDIIKFAKECKSCTSEELGEVTKVNFIDDYANHLVDIIRKGANIKDSYNEPLKGLKIIVDAGNGAGGFFADKVLKPLGACTEGSQFLEPDGNFPNHIPNPENQEAMKSIKEAVIKNSADFGIIFDTDVDRAAVVGCDGLEVNRNSLIALISAIVLEENPNSIIVTDSITSTGLTNFIESLGGVHHRFKRGYKNVINESKRLNREGKESSLAIETSGHAAFKENYFLDDGAYLISKVLIKIAKLSKENKKITTLIESLSYPVESLDVRIKINEEDFRSYGTKVIEALEEYVKSINGWRLPAKNYEGIKVCCDDNSGSGWLLLRLSLHEPVLALNIESEVPGGVEIIKNKLFLLFKQFNSLDLDKFNN